MEYTNSKRSWESVIVAVHVLAVFLGLPLVYRDFYYDILNVKYFYYLGCVLMMVLLLLSYMMYRCWKNQDLKTTKRMRWTQNFSETDIAVLVFGIIAIISTMLSPFRYEAFWGNEGRYTGMLLLVIYVVAYFCITRCLNYRTLFLNAMLFSGMLVAILGITDFWNMDLLGFKKFIRDDQYEIFTSTIGNINTYTALISIYLGTAAVLFAMARRWWETMAYYICVCIFFFAMITGVSDNAYLALGALFGFLPLYLFKSRRGVRRYVVLLATFFSISQAIGIICIRDADRVIQIKGLFNYIAGYDKLYLINLALWGIAGVVWVVDAVKHRLDNKMHPFARKLWLCLIGAGVCALLYVLYDANIAGNAKRYGSLKKYLVFNDAWGTHRGYIWRIAVENYWNMPLIQKIFGYGPDTFGILTYFNNLDEMMSRYDQLFDSVHNEYLQYFVTMGPIGCGAYLVILISTIRTFIKKGLNDPEVMAVLFAVLCYSAQALVNINQPISMPIMWTLLCVGMAKCRRG